MTQNSGSALWHKAKKIIPGGNQLLSKRSEQFLPDFWPAYYRKSKGVDIWDLDNNHFIDMSTSGIGACPLGYADPDVNAAVIEAIKQGSMCTLNCPEEIDLAETMVRLHPWADRVKFSRSGGEAMTVAIRIARARSGKDKIAFCGYHGWHDWYLAANLVDDCNLDGHLLPGLSPRGVPRGLTGTALPFRYNHGEELEAIISKNKNEIAAIVMEPIRDHAPDPEFLKTIQNCAADIDAALIIDEVSAGFRLTTGGAHLKYGIKPDIAVFAKAISNGFPMAAIIGKSDVMEAAQDTFISSTYWTERVGFAAALATIEKYQRCNVPDHIIDMGKLVQKGWKNASAQAGIEVEVSGIPPLSHFSVPCSQSLVAQTYFTQTMLEKGILAGTSFYPTFSHQLEHIDRYLTAVDEIFSDLSDGLKRNTLQNMLKGPVARSGFYRLT